jgi:hypothetical protein
MEKPIQPLEVWYVGAYAQDDWRAATTSASRPASGSTSRTSARPASPTRMPDALTFRDETATPCSTRREKLPDPNVLWSPRVGFNWDVGGTRQTQVRGGTGIFTGKPAYVWISNQIGNTAC